MSDAHEVEDLVRLFDRYVHAWTTFDDQLLVSLFADDAVYTDPYPSAPYRGKAGVAQIMADIRRTVTALHFELARPILCRDRGIFPFHLRATVDGVTRRIRATDVVVARGGLIVELTGYGDFRNAEVVGAPAS